MSKPLFKEVSYSLSKLMDDIEMGNIGLPDIQRPFVWPNRKVRDLFDSMYRGYPIGYLLFWENKVNKGVKQIGVNSHQKVPQLLIVDGQQRLTSLFAVMKNIKVIRDNYDSESIEIAFHPLSEKFEVADASIRRNPEWIPNVSKVLLDEVNQYKAVTEFIAQLKTAKSKVEEVLTPEEEDKISQSLQNLFGIKSFPFTVLELSADIDEEQVAEVFVRINSKGKTLNQSDFILTLMSVFWEDGRKELEQFCRAARNPQKGEAGPFNHFIDPDPDQLLRVSIGYGFRRARLKYAYSLLRGKDLESGDISDEQRDRQFEKLKAAQSQVLNLQNWHDFLLAIQHAGYRSSKMVSSETTLMYAYVFYLIGKLDLKVPDKELSKAIGEWFFVTNLTLRYISSAETAMERDLADLRGMTTPEAFLSWMRKTIDSELTDDFWRATLPVRLESSSANTPVLHCYHAALHILDAKALFSDIKVWDALDPTTKAYKNKVERHHLFPRNYLKGFGITSVRETNQIANYAYVEWKENLAISDSAPSEYFEVFTNNIDSSALEKMKYWHALPDDWESMTYDEFLGARRKLIAQVTKDGFKKLAQGKIIIEKPQTIEQMIAVGEGSYTEFKSTLRVNLHTNEKDPKMEHAVLKTINGFLNTDGGYLVIGVADDGAALGLDIDGFANEDKMDLHLGNIVMSRMGPETMLHIKPRFEDFKGSRIMLIDCKPSQVPVFLKNGSDEEFYIRAGGSSAKLIGRQLHDYIKQRFPN
ncbi:GmrSD restriction endonuclease domain-containing protein [Muriicola marianensis]|uniref:DUF262 domain-containing protein n=1 Tax=Muriicola marianensis TaxID=1324801 RepID=A0ABQ1QYQ8_9FLAO|nr:DUF262 domain-containing protein [Muriicola marianensis]GGD50446.1 hypothetical protein GCM10011361_16390 [Muriicola marianensis]